LLVAAALVCAPAVASAHWCNNIWAAPSRIVVKPEVTSLFVGSGGAKLRVYVQNNLPYKMFGVQMRGQAGGYSIQVSPAKQDINPGQNVSFIFTVSGKTGTAQVNNLGLQLQFRSGYPYGWQTGSSNCMLDQTTTTNELLAGTSGWWQSYSYCKLANQATALNAAALWDKLPNQKLSNSPGYLGRTGIQQVIKRFGYRFCWNAGGSWRSGNNECPSPSPEGSSWTSTAQWGQDCMRAGVMLAQRKTKLGSHIGAARLGALNALTRNISAYQHKCLAAVVGAYLYAGSGATGPFTTALKLATNKVPTACQNAGLRILNQSPKATCASGQYWERAACAAAEGLRGNDAVVKSVLMTRAGDGYQPYGGNYDSLYYSYMLSIVTAARMASVGKISFYPDAGSPLSSKPDQKVVKPDQKIVKPDQKIVKPDQKIVPKPDQKIVKPDQKIVPKPDQKVVPKPDQKVVPKPDQKVVPKPDKKVVKKDKGTPPPPDMAPPKKDQKVVKKDQKVVVKKDIGTTPPVDDGDEDGGCSVAAGGGSRGVSGLGLLALLLLALVRRRR